MVVSRFVFRVSRKSLNTKQGTLNGYVGMAGILYIVATPLGNLEDITYRAVKILSSCDAIACEDSRRTVKLLNRYEIKSPLFSYHEYNKESAGRKILAKVKSGAKIALVSDAGTPAISDPGFNLVRDAIEEGIHVEAIPGPSAIVTALVLSGLPTDRFTFEGFLPPKGEKRRRKLSLLLDEERTMVFYESPHRIRESMEDMAALFGERKGALIREMTKLNEEVIRGNLSHIGEILAERERVLGEITLVIEGARIKESIAENIDILIREESESFDGPPSELAKKLSRETGISRSAIYAKLLSNKEKK